jgi:hypothetical protein
LPQVQQIVGSSLDRVNQSCKIGIFAASQMLYHEKCFDRFILNFSFLALANSPSLWRFNFIWIFSLQGPPQRTLGQYDWAVFQKKIKMWKVNRWWTPSDCMSFILLICVCVCVCAVMFLILGVKSSWELMLVLLIYVLTLNKSLELWTFDDKSPLNCSAGGLIKNIISESCPEMIYYGTLWRNLFFIHKVCFLLSNRSHIIHLKSAKKTKNNYD